MPAPKGNTIEGLHLGAMLSKILHAKRVSHAVLGRRIGRDQSLVKVFVGRSSMQAYLIWELSIALKHNFFADLAHQLDAATEGKLDQQRTELQQLQEDYNRLKEERDYLRKAIDMLSPK